MLSRSERKEADQARSAEARVGGITPVPLKIHFIAGLPRSGSTLLAALLRQNPGFHASMSGPVASMFMNTSKSMSGANEMALFISNDTRERVLRTMVEAYYATIPDSHLIFDTSRSWCALLPILCKLFPQSLVLCCVRSPAWILDSIERHVQANLIQPSRMFSHEPAGNVYTRIEALIKGGFVGGSLSALRQAWFGEHASRLIAVRYESLAEHPNETLQGIYEFLGEPHFVHDFEHVDYREPEYDEVLGLPGFHTVAPRVELKKRTTILPPDLFSQHNRPFWDMPGQNPRGVRVL
jgi:sulfotransferase